MLRKAAGRLLFNRNNLTPNQKAPAGRLIKHRNMNNNLNYNGQSSIEYQPSGMHLQDGRYIDEVIEGNKRIVEELNAMYNSVRRF